MNILLRIVIDGDVQKKTGKRPEQKHLTLHVETLFMPELKLLEFGGPITKITPTFWATLC
jgi:hypothetical protein